MRVSRGAVVIVIVTMQICAFARSEALDPASKHSLVQPILSEANTPDMKQLQAAFLKMSNQLAIASITAKVRDAVDPASMSTRHRRTSQVQHLCMSDDQCVDLTYNPCDLSLVVSSSALPTDFSVSLAQEVNQCHDLSTEQLQALAQAVGMDNSQLSLIRSMDPAICVSLSGIQHTEDEMAFDTRVYLHATKSFFGIRPPDVTVPGMQRQVTFDAACAAPTAQPTMQPTEAPTTEPSTEAPTTEPPTEAPASATEAPSSAAEAEPPTEACTLTHGSATYDLAPLKSTSRTYAYTDEGESTSYYFSICNRADDIASTECVDAANNYTKMPVFACQIADQRAGLISLGVDQVLTPYEAGPGIPAFAGASGVRIRMTGGTQCHHNPRDLPDGNPYREMDVWLKCNPDATDSTIVAPPVGVEETYCEYDFLLESSHGCRLCTDSDYVGSVVDPAPIDGQDGCRDDGNQTIRYEKKAGVQCSHGRHGGATTSADLNEFCAAAPEFVSNSGACSVTQNGQCVQSANFGSGGYDHEQSCTITVTGDVTFRSTEFQTEAGYDTMTYHGGSYSGDSGPLGVLSGSESISWSSDSSEAAGGWQLCIGAAVEPSVPSPCVDDDTCLRNQFDWTEYDTCENNAQYCNGYWSADMLLCCQHTCNSTCTGGGGSAPPNPTPSPSPTPSPTPPTAQPTMQPVVTAQPTMQVSPTVPPTEASSSTSDEPPACFTEEEDIECEELAGCAWEPAYDGAPGHLGSCQPSGPTSGSTSSPQVQHFCAGDQCIDMTYNPCDLSLVVSSSALPTDFSVSLAQEVNQCHDLSTEQLQALAQAAGVAGSQLTILSALEPAICVSLSGIQHTEDEMAFDARVYLHATKSMLGINVDRWDVTVPGMQRQVTFDAACAAPSGSSASGSASGSGEEEQSEDERSSDEEDSPDYSPEDSPCPDCEFVVDCDDCNVVQSGRCVQSSGFDGDTSTSKYNPNEQCTINVRSNSYASTEDPWAHPKVRFGTVAFNTEYQYDKLTIGNTEYSGSNVSPSGWLLAHEEITWISDGTLSDGGWRLCLEDGGSASGSGGGSASGSGRGSGGGSESGSGGGGASGSGECNGSGCASVFVSNMVPCVDLARVLPWSSELYGLYTPWSPPQEVLGDHQITVFASQFRHFGFQCEDNMEPDICYLVALGASEYGLDEMTQLFQARCNGACDNLHPPSNGWVAVNQFCSGAMIELTSSGGSASGSGGGSASGSGGESASCSSDSAVACVTAYLVAGCMGEAPQLDGIPCEPYGHCVMDACTGGTGGGSGSGFASNSSFILKDQYGWSSDCVVTQGGRCVQSSRFMAGLETGEGYSNHDSCLIGVTGTDPVHFSAEFFSTEAQFDTFTFRDQTYSGLVGPEGVIDSTDSLSWSSDGSMTSNGWQLCLDSVGPSPSDEECCAVDGCYNSGFCCGEGCEGWNGEGCCDGQPSPPPFPGGDGQLCEGEDVLRCGTAYQQQGCTGDSPQVPGISCEPYESCIPQFCPGGPTHSVPGCGDEPTRASSSCSTCDGLAFIASAGICTGCMNDVDKTPITQDNVGNLSPPAEMCASGVDDSSTRHFCFGSQCLDMMFDACDLAMHVSSTGLVPNMTVSLWQEASQCHDLTTTQLQALGQLAQLDAQQMSMITSTEPQLCVATHDIQNTDDLITFQISVFVHPTRPVFGMVIPDMQLVDNPMQFRSECSSPPPSVEPSPSLSPALIPSVQPTALASETNRVTQCFRDQCVDLTYNPCDLSLVVSSSALPTDFSVSLAQEVNQCHDLSTEQLQALAQAVGMDNSQLSLISSLDPAICVSLSGIQHTEDEMAFDARVYLHATKSFFGIRPPDVTVPGMQRQVTFDAACAAPTAQPTMLPPGGTPTVQPTVQPTMQFSPTVSPSLTAQPTMLPSPTTPSEGDVFKQMCLRDKCIDLMYNPCDLTLFVSSELLPNDIRLSLAQDVSQCVDLSAEQLQTLGQAVGIDSSSMSSLDPALCIKLSGVQHTRQELNFEAQMYVHPQKSLFGSTLPDFYIPGLDQQISFQAVCTPEGGVTSEPTSKPTSKPTTKPTIAPSNKPSPPPPVTVATLTQLVTFDDLSPTDYTGHVKLAYELGFGDSCGVVAFADGTVTVKPGYTITSQVARRSAGVTFQLTAPSLEAEDLDSKAEKLDGTRLARAIKHVVKTSSELSDVSVPSADEIELSAPSVSTDMPVDSEDKPAGIISDNGISMGMIFGMIVGGLALITMVALFAVLYYRKRNLPEAEVEMPSFNSTSHIENSHLPVSQLDVGTDDPDEDMVHISPRGLDKMMNDAAESSGTSPTMRHEGVELLTDNRQDDLSKHDTL